MRKRGWFIAINVLLLLLFLWTLTEQTAVTVQIRDGVCTAVLRERTSTIPCPNLDDGTLGLYIEAPRTRDRLNLAPLAWLAPTSAWRGIHIRAGGEELALPAPFTPDVPLWWRVLGEWRPIGETAVLLWDAPAEADYTFTATIRRPHDRAGLLLLEPGGRSGYAYVTAAQVRQGVWWRWEDGALAEPIIGVPFQKSVLAQSQSLLRRVLAAHQGGLILLLVAWAAARGLRRLRPPALPCLGSWRGVPAAVVVLALWIFFAAAFVAVDLLEAMPHVQDSITYLFQARTLARGQLSAPPPPVPAAFEQEFMTVFGGRWFGQYAPGFPALLALGVLVGQPWIVNPLLAVLTVPLLVGLGMAIYGRSTALLAAGLLAVSPFFLFMSGSMMSHSAMLFWTTLFMLAWSLAVWRERSWGWALLAGVALGMGLLTRQATAVAVGTAFAGVLALGWLRQAGLARRRWLLARLMLLAVGSAPFVLALLAYQALLTGDPLQDSRVVNRPFDRVGFGPDHGEQTNVFLLSPLQDGYAVSWYIDPEAPPRGHSLARGLYNTEQNWRALEFHLFGWPVVFTLGFCWLAFLLHRPGWPDVALLATFGAVVGIYVTFWAAGIMYGPRYYFAALPALVLLTAHGVHAAAAWLGGSPGRWALGGLVALLVAVNLVTYLPGQVAAHRGFNFVDASYRARVETAVSGKALVFVPVQAGNWWEYGRYFSGNTPWLDDRIIYARDLDPQTNRGLMAAFPDRFPYRLRQGEPVPYFP